MITQVKITALRMERQHLTRRADEAEYIDLYRDSQPGLNVFWNGFGDPPSLTYRADFNDIEYNRERQRKHKLVKGRFSGGNLGWIMPEDLELFAVAFIKPLVKPSPRHTALLELIEQEPLTIQQMKEETGLLVKEITPVLHRLQEAFLIFEDQYDGEWDRGWHMFSAMFPEVDLQKYTRHEAIKILIQRFAYRLVCIDSKPVKSFYKFPDKDIKVAITALVDEKILTETDQGYMMSDDMNLIQSYDVQPHKSVYALHRNDVLVKSNEHWLKERYTHTYPDTMYYLLIDGEFKGIVTGKFRYTPEIEDVTPDLPDDEAMNRKNEILEAVRVLCGKDNPIKRYQGELL